MTFDAADADAVLVNLAELAATTLSVETQKSAINEQHDLQPHCARAARTIAERPENIVEVASQDQLLIEDWPRLGKVDLALTWPSRDRVLVELKCGAKNDTLGPCVWDALKCAFALHVGLASAAYLLAGAPETSWSKPIRAAELLSTRSWDTADLRDRYADWWRQWEKCGDPQPVRLPSSFSTVAVGTFPFQIKGTSWELRLARIERVGELVDWPRFLPPPPSAA